MKSLKLISALLVLFASSSNAQIKNNITENVKIYGNCGMCEKTIETAGNIKKVAQVDWNKDTQMATITYDAKKTNQDEILKRIALAGYDSDQFLAPDDTYASLPSCCQYERVHKESEMNMGKSISKNSKESEMSYTEMKHEPTTISAPIINQQEVDPLTTVFAAYFEMKDALVQTDGELAAIKSSTLLTSINDVKMEKLPMDVHMVWMKILKDLKQDSEAIANNKDVDTQRSHFINLSKNMYDLIKVAKYEEPVYYQFCPMANDGKGANWLSKENVVKNPYYGSKMLSCGKVVETINK